MSAISRSEYQRVCEENKRLKKDIEILTSTDFSAERILLKAKWRKHFEDKKKQSELITYLIKLAANEK